MKPRLGIGRWWIAMAMLLVPLWASAQVVYPLGSSGSMGLGSPNGEFTVAQDDLRVKVPGGYVRVNRDFDGTQWVFNRQWSGLGNPSYYQGSYRSIGSFYTCTIVDGISNCDTTAAGSVVSGISLQPIVHGVRVPNDPNFGRDADGRPKLQSSIEALARKGVGFSRSTDGTSYVSSKHPRFLVRPRQVPVLPASPGPNAHPSAGKPGQGGVTVVQIEGYRWTDRSGEWIEYDNFGRISSYGDRNDVRVWFQYGNHGQIERVLDDNGRTVFTFLYKDGGQFITEARDHTPIDGSIRRYQYHYTDNGYLSRVVDARGGETRFEYGRSTGSMLPGGNGLPDSGNPVYSIVKVTDAENRVLKVEFGPTERISKITAPDGGVTDIEYGYDKLKREFSTTVKHPETSSGRKIETSRYDVEGRLVYRDVNGKTSLTAQGSGSSMSYVDGSGGTVTINRDNFDEITSRTNSDGSTVRYVYDSSSLDVKEVVDEKGTSTRLDYDAKGNLARMREAANSTEEQITEYSVNERGEPENVVRKGGLNADGGTEPDVGLNLLYDDHGNIRQLVDGEGKVWKYEYDALGNVTHAQDPLGHQWGYTYDKHGNRLTETDPNNLTTAFSYDASDRLLTITNPREQTYRFTYDAAGRPNTMTDPTGATSVIEYDAAGRTIRNKDATNHEVQYAYDVFDRLISVTDGNGDTTTLGYTDPDGVDRGTSLVSKIQYPTFQQLLRYNSRQRLTQIAGVVDGTVRTAQLSYDTLGSITTTTNANGKSKNAHYDALGRPTSSTNELGQTVRLAYDRRGNLVKVTDPLGHAIRFEYDKRDKLVRETNAENQTTAYVYNDAGRLNEIRRPNGFKLAFTFDAGGRLQQRQSYRPDGAIELIDTFSWDGGNRLVAWTSGSASSASTYDDADRLLSETVTVDGVTMTRRYTYYTNGQVRSYTGPDGVTLTYTYDGNGGLARLDIPGEGSMSVSERQWLKPKKVIFPGGTLQETERDGLLHPTRLRVRSPSQSQLFEQTSTYGSLNEVLNRSTQGREVEYAYDDALRLIEANPTSGTAETFQLDAVGNRSSDNIETNAWQYDDANRLLQRGTISYQYDASGNLVRKTDASLVGPQRTTNYAYDGYSRLIEVSNGNDEVVARYAYDPFGYRLTKEVTSIGAANTGAPMGKYFFLQAEEGLLAEIDTTGVVTRSYGWDPEGTYGTSPLFLRNGTGYFYYHNDPLGQPLLLTNKEGAVVWEALRTSAFGAVTGGTGAAIEQPLRFPGQYFDAETGFHYNVHRYYDPTIGRYVTEDPLGLNGGINLYLYADASPTKYIDIYGLNFGEPGLAESFIPVWGSLREGINDFQCGRIGWGIFNTVLAITDATGIGYGARALAKGGWKTTKYVFQEWWKNTDWKKMNERLQRVGVTTKNSWSTPRSEWITTDHIAVKQRHNLPNWITNFPLNLQFDVPQWLNTSFEKMTPLQRFMHLEPWRKAGAAGVGSYLTGLIPQPKKDDSESNCACD